MRRSSLVLISMLAAGGAAACANDDPTPDHASTGALADPDFNTASIVSAPPGQPVPGLTPRQLAQFNRGLQVFVTEFSPATGLGPLFNSTSCAQCHNDPALGGYGDSAEVHVTAYHGGNSCQVLDNRGGPVVQQHATPLLQAALGITKEPTPAGATGSGARSTSLIFGLGLLDAVPDRTILELARTRQPDGVHGRPAILSDGRIGRFGRKATTARLAEFNAGAFFNEMGVTNPLNPVEGTVAGLPLPPGTDPAQDPELSPDAMNAADAFVQFLAPPAPLPATDQIRLGQRLFRDIRCTTCHQQTLTTGWNQVAALSNKRVNAYTDLLLHDMGPDLADICNGVARPSEFRTQPLIGMQFLDMFMHDGESHTIADAVKRHGGEGAAARARFFRLDSTAQAAVSAFVSSL